MRRDLKLSVSRNNRDIFDIWRSIQAVDPHPSSTVIKWIRERYALEWKNRNKVLSPPQQIVTTPKYIRPPKTEAEIRQDDKRKEDELRKQEEIKRQRRAAYEAAKEFMEKQD